MALSVRGQGHTCLLFHRLFSGGHTRPCSGACHEISHALGHPYRHRVANHGEQVGVGAAFATYLRGEHGTARLMADVLRRHGLPVVARELGFSDEEFVRVVGFVPETRPGRAVQFDPHSPAP